MTSKQLKGKFRYTKEQEEWLRNNIDGVKYADLAEMFNKEFGTNTTSMSIGTKCFRLGISNNYRGTGRQFEKGMTPWNKGIKGLTKANKTSFKKGNIPPNYVPVGSERITRDGYREIKVKDPRTWQPYQRYIWEKEAGETLNKNDVVVFLDQDKTNFDFDNLAKVTRGELLKINQKGYLVDDPELSKLGINIVRLKRVIREKKNERK